MSLVNLFKNDLSQCCQSQKITHENKKQNIHNLFDNLSKTIHDNQVPRTKPIAHENNTKLEELFNSKPSEIVVNAPRVLEPKKLEVDIEKLRELNMKYLQVINDVNEELLKIKTETPRKLNVLEEENKKLSQKVNELSNALINAINQNKTLSKALSMRNLH